MNNMFSLHKTYGISRLISISSMDSIFDYDGIIPRYFDLVALGGGPNAVYLIGLYDILKKLQRTGDITISKYVGSDIAAIVMVCLCSNMEKQQIINFMKLMFHDITNDYWKKEFLRILPSNSYKICSNRVYIYTSVPICKGIFSKPKVFFEYYSNRDLIEACSISCKKPSVIEYCGTEKQLKIWINKLNGFDWIFFQKKQLYQLYKLKMNKIITKAKRDADTFFTQKSTSNTISILEWCHPSSFKNKKHIFYYFIPSTIILFFLLKKIKIKE